MKMQTAKSFVLHPSVVAFLVILVLLSPITGTAQQPGTGSSVLPQFVFGDVWYTAMYFTNLSAEPVSFPVYFYSDLGTPLIVPSFGTSSTNVTIAPYGTAMIEAKNVGSSSQGYATFTLPVGVGGYGVFRRSPPGEQEQEAVVPFASSNATTATLTWDENNLTTGVAVVNPSPTTATITITARNAAGATIGTSSMTLQPFSHTAAGLSAFPGLSGVVGQSGSAQFTASTGRVAVLGLRVRASAMTSIPPTESTFEVSAFKAGKYVGPLTQDNGKDLVTISGPGTFQGGATAWTLTPSAGASRYVYPEKATFYVGPIESNPLADRIKKAGITSTAWSYGIGSTAFAPSSCWSDNVLLGFSQIGNTINIACFTTTDVYGMNQTDTKLPGDQITFTLLP